MQYLIDMDILVRDNLDNYNFKFSNFEITPLMLACAIGK